RRQQQIAPWSHSGSIVAACTPVPALKELSDVCSFTLSFPGNDAKLRREGEEWRREQAHATMPSGAHAAVCHVHAVCSLGAGARVSRPSCKDRRAVSSRWNGGCHAACCRGV